MTKTHIKLLILDRRATNADLRLADMVVAECRIVKNRWGDTTIGQMRLTPKERLAVERALGKSK